MMAIELVNEVSWLVASDEQPLSKNDFLLVLANTVTKHVSRDEVDSNG